MKIVFAGGGTGGHFYPIIAVAQAINKLAREKKLISPSLYYFGPNPYNPGLLYDNKIEFKKVTAGKTRRYFSLMNLLDVFKIGWGSLMALFDLFDVYPDVVFGKGGYGSFPTILAARLLRIPVVIHESDSRPGRVNSWAGKFAEHVAVSYPEATKFFKEGKVAWTGQPIQRTMLEAEKNGAHRFFEFEEGVPTIFILGGSQGAEKINDAILDTLPQLVKRYQIIHQTGANNLKVVKETADAILLDSKNKNRYRTYGYLNPLEERTAAGCADIVISRAGSTIFEIASWGKASIIIPIGQEISHDQTTNASIYSSSGAASVIDESNLTSSILLAEIARIAENENLRKEMEQNARAFFKPDADNKIAEELLRICLMHEKAE